MFKQTREIIAAGKRNVEGEHELHNGNAIAGSSDVSNFKRFQWKIYSETALHEEAFSAI